MVSLSNHAVSAFDRRDHVRAPGSTPLELSHRCAPRRGFDAAMIVSPFAIVRGL